MGRWMHLAIAVATGACLILSATAAFAGPAGYCRNPQSDPENPNCWQDYSPSGGNCSKGQCDQKKEECLDTCKGSACSGCSSLSCEGACAKWTYPGVGGKPAKKCDDRSAEAWLMACDQECFDSNDECQTGPCACLSQCAFMHRRGAC